MSSQAFRDLILVIGSCNIDLICYTPNFPKTGETTKGTAFKKGFGGKGANQAVAAAKLGAKMSMVAKLGKDSHGTETIQNFETVGVDSKNILIVDDETASGVAFIEVDQQGNNRIVIVGGTNELLSVEDIRNSRPVIKQSGYLLCQFEIPVPSTIEAMRIAKEEGVQVILNPAPAPTKSELESLPKDFFQLCDYVCPNETELERLTGLPVQSVEDAKKASYDLLKQGARNVLVTLGAQGCLLVTKDEEFYCPLSDTEKNIKVVDTTGAGDCFLGSLVTFLSHGFPIKDAMKKSNYVATQSVQKEGTQTSYPLKTDLPQSLFQ